MILDRGAGKKERKLGRERERVEDIERYMDNGERERTKDKSLTNSR